MAVKALNKNDCEWWSNKVECAYENFKTRVKNSIPVYEVNDFAENLYYKNMLLRAINECETKGFPSNMFSVNDYGRTIDISVTIVKDENHKEYVDEERNIYMNERCKQIRAICEPYQKKRDEFLVLIHSRPTQDDLGAIVEWCDSLDALYKNEGECYL